MEIEPMWRMVLPPSETIHIVQVGVGGTGSHMATALGQLAYHAKQRGIAVELMLVDHDRVEAKNVGRQLFCPAEIGLNKAEAMAWRLSSALGLQIAAVSEPFTYKLYQRFRQYALQEAGSVLLVGCVDNHLARQEMATCVEQTKGKVWWLDTGNAKFNGHVRIGNLSKAESEMRPSVDVGLLHGLPAPHVQEPALLQPDPVPQMAESCAEWVAADAQSVMVNRVAAAVAATVVGAFVLEREVYGTVTYFNMRPFTCATRRLEKWGSGEAKK